VYINALDQIFYEPTAHHYQRKNEHAGIDAQDDPHCECLKDCDGSLDQVQHIETLMGVYERSENIAWKLESREESHDDHYTLSQRKIFRIDLKYTANIYGNYHTDNERENSNKKIKHKRVGIDRVYPFDVVHSLAFRKVTIDG